MKIKYPNPSIEKPKNRVLKSRGMLFEEALNLSNEYYLLHDKAVIYKKPTPIQVVRVDYPNRTKAKIVEAYYKVPSTTDYNGIYKGKYIDYEAKETVNNSFAFAHIFPHQIEHLFKVKKHGGIAFVFIFFRKANEAIIIDIDVFNNLYVNAKKGGTKSISYEEARQLGVVVEETYTPPFDYLKAVNNLYHLI